MATGKPTFQRCVNCFTSTSHLAAGSGVICEECYNDYESVPKYIKVANLIKFGPLPKKLPNSVARGTLRRGCNI